MIKYGNEKAQLDNHYWLKAGAAANSSCSRVPLCSSVPLVAFVPCVALVHMPHIHMQCSVAKFKKDMQAHSTVSCNISQLVFIRACEIGLIGAYAARKIAIHPGIVLGAYDPL